MLAEDFMELLAPSHWPAEDRVGFCYQPPESHVTECEMKQGVFRILEYKNWKEIGLLMNVVAHIAL